MKSDQKVFSMSDFMAVVPGGSENMKLCLEGNKTLERGATMEEVSEAIKTMRLGKAPGPDSISDKCLKMLKINRKLSFLERFSSTSDFLKKDRK